MSYGVVLVVVAPEFSPEETLPEEETLPDNEDRSLAGGVEGEEDRSSMRGAMMGK